MRLSRREMNEIVKNQLAVDMNCEPSDFNKNGVVFCQARENQGRRMFERQKPYLEAATMGKSTVISGEIEVLSKAKELFVDKTRDDIYASGVFYGHTLYYLPDIERIKSRKHPENLSFHVKEGDDIFDLYKIKGFENAIQYDQNHPCKDEIAVYFKDRDRIIAMAGASSDSEFMWQIGIDVSEEYRNRGLASILVSEITLMIMDKGKVPYYGTSSANIPSQSVAYRSGFSIAWMCSYRNTIG